MSERDRSAPDGIVNGHWEPVPDEVHDEGIAQKGYQPKKKNGRPKKQLPLATLLRQMPSVEEQILANPRGYDPGVGDKQLSLLGRIIFERGLCADEKEIPLRNKVALAVQILQFIENSGKTNVWRRGEQDHPRTSAALDAEVAQRNQRLAKLRPYLLSKKDSVPTEHDVEVVVEALRPPGEPQ